MKRNIKAEVDKVRRRAGIAVTHGTFRGSDRPLIPATCPACQRTYYWRSVPEECPWPTCGGKLK